MSTYGMEGTYSSCPGVAARMWLILGVHLAEFRLREVSVLGLVLYVEDFLASRLPSGI